MVQDPVCGVYLPAGKALAEPGASGAAVHFCSEACRSAWRRGSSPSGVE
jgi:YHS domain-containing protein